MNIIKEKKNLFEKSNEKYSIVCSIGMDGIMNSKTLKEINDNINIQKQLLKAFNDPETPDYLDYNVPVINVINVVNSNNPDIVLCLTKENFESTSNASRIRQCMKEIAKSYSKDSKNSLKAKEIRISKFDSDFESIGWETMIKLLEEEFKNIDVNIIVCE